MLRKVLSVMLLATILIFVGAEKNAAAQEFDFVQLTTGRVRAGWVVDGIDFLALRTGPSVNYTEIARMPPGAYIEVTFGGADNYTNFLSVTYRGMHGYAHQRYIRLGRVLYDLP